MKKNNLLKMLLTSQLTVIIEELKRKKQIKKYNIIVKIYKSFAGEKNNYMEIYEQQ